MQPNVPATSSMGWLAGCEAERCACAADESTGTRTPWVTGTALLRELEATVPPELGGSANQWSRRGAAVLHLLRLDDGGKGQVIGGVRAADEVRLEARQAIDKLRRNGAKKIVTITGGARPVAEVVAADLATGPASTRCSPKCCRLTRTVRWPTCRRAA